MADDNTKDVKLRITGQDNSGSAMKSAAGNVGKLTGALKDQVKAQEAAAEAAAKNYGATGAALKDAQEKAVAARKAYADLSVEVAKAGEPSKKLIADFERLGKAADRADKDVERLTSKLAKETTNVSTQKSLLESLYGTVAERQAAERGSLRLATAIEEAANRQAGAQVAAQQRVASSSAITAAQQEAERREAERGSLRLAAALEEVGAAQARAGKLAAFQQVGADAELAANRIGTLGAATTQAGAGLTSLRTDLQGIIDPSVKARATLDGLETEIARLDAVVGAADKPLRNYQDAINDLGRVQTDALRQAGAIDQYKQQADAVRRAEAAFTTAKAEVLQYAQAVRQADAPNDALAASLAHAETNLKGMNLALEQERTKLAALKAPLDAARISTANLAKEEERLKNVATTAAAAVKRLDVAASGQGSKTGKFLGLRPYELTNLSFQINDVITQLASGTSLAQTAAQQGGQILQLFPGIFARIIGFAPQIIAITAVATTALGAIKTLLDQQASVREFSGALALNADAATYNASALANNARTLDVYGAKLGEAREAVKTFVNEGLDPAQFEAFGKTAIDVADITGQKIPEAAKLMAESFTGGWTEVQKLDEAFNFLTLAESEHIKAMFESGQASEARAESFRIFQERAQQGADKARGDWSDAARSFTTAWGNLMDRLANTDAVEGAIRQLDRLGRMVSYVFGLLGGKDTSKVGDKAVSVVAERAQKKLAKLEEEQGRIDKGGFGGLVARYQSSDRTKLFGDEERRAEIARLRSVITNEQTAATQRLQKAEALLTDRYTDQSHALTGLTRAERIAAAAVRVADARKKAALEAGKLNLDTPAVQRIADLAGKTEQARIDREIKAQDEADKKKGAASARRAASAAKRDENAARAAAAKREALESQLVNDLNSLEVKAARTQQASLADRQAAIDAQYSKIFDTIAKLEKAGGTSIRGKSFADYKAEVEANKTLLKQEDQLKYYQESTKALENERKSRLSAILSLQEEGAISTTEAFDRALAVEGELGPQVAKMADDAIVFAEAVGGANPSPELKAFVEAMKIARNTGPKAVKATGATLNKSAETDLNAAIQQRNNLVATTNALMEAGIITQEQAKQRTAAAYAESLPKIRELIAEYRKLLDATRTPGDEMVYAEVTSSLDLMGQQAVYVDSNFKLIHDTIVNGLGQGAVDAFTQITTIIGQAANGTISWGDALDSLGAVALNFASTFLQQLAGVIAQIAILQAIQSLPFLNGLTSGIMDFTGLAAGASVLAGAGTTVAGASVALGTSATLAAGAGTALGVSATALGVSGTTVAAAAVALGVSAAALAAAAELQIVASTVGLFHSGGVVGSPGSGGRSRKMGPISLAGVPRYHSGSPGVGLKKDEQLAILQKGEQVLTEDDPNHIMNRNKGATGGVGASPTVNLKNVVVFDPGQALADGLSTKAGEQAMFTFVNQNPNLFRRND